MSTHHRLTYLVKAYKNKIKDSQISVMLSNMLDRLNTMLLAAGHETIKNHIIRANSLKAA
ncbi:hypothetical protein Sps_04795 [Shewanella psychrophila]|uniref:Uncharacterized protein n=1 Tax=Shewanella psychrophila TaxID=225848 RepID=A0A1S6HWC5_9GAMM|nr:hypothetical protein Sps_04795 [Shewanella psychrophila]